MFGAKVKSLFDRVRDLGGATDFAGMNRKDRRKFLKHALKEYDEKKPLPEETVVKKNKGMKVKEAA